MGRLDDGEDEKEKRLCLTHDLGKRSNATSLFDSDGHAGSFPKFFHQNADVVRIEFPQ